MKKKLSLNNKTLLMLSFLLLQNVILFGQSSDLDKEKDVKISGNYFWSQATATSDAEAKKQASELLLLSDEVKNTPNLNQKNISYIAKQRGNKVLAIAYIAKNGIEKSSTNPTESGTIPVPEKVKENNTNNNFVNKQEVTKSDIIEIKKEVVSNISESKTKQLSNSSLINSLLDIDDINSILKELNTFKMKGKIMYSSRIEAFDNSNQCYIIIYEETTNKILYLLDKGDETRVNLLDSKKINIKQNQLINQLSKIYVYEF